MKRVDFNNEISELEAGLEFAGSLGEHLKYNEHLKLLGDQSLVTLPIVSAIETSQGRLLLTDIEGGMCLIEILFRN